MSTSEAVVGVIVLVVCGLWDLLIMYQVWRGETIAFSSAEYEQPRSRSRKTEPGPFWVAIGIQAIVPNGAILYLLWFWTTTLAN